MLLYSHTEMIGDLLQGFLPGAWVKALDLATLEKCSGSLDEQHVAEQGDLPQRNLSVALFRLEASRTPAEAERPEQRVE